MVSVAVQLLAFDEDEATLSETFESINNQVVDRRVQVDKQAWITPAYPDDPSFDVAERHGFTAKQADQGKLTSRNQAHAYALRGGADAIVEIDADAPMLHSSVLSELIRPLRDGSAVATNSMPVAYAHPTDGTSLLGMGVDMAGRIEDMLFPHMHGQCSAFTARAWRKAGPFDTEIDQTNGHVVRSEEELQFYRRLRELGTVELVPAAKVYNDPRRHFCKLAPPLAPDGYCEARGERTFGDEGKR